MSKTLLKNIKTLYQVREMCSSPISGLNMKELPCIHDAFLALEDGIIVAFGEMNQLEGMEDWNNLEVIDCEDRFVLPAFIDSHTHTVFARSREEEFVDRIKGLSYEEIAAKGGGILNSAHRLQEATEKELYASAKIRIEEMIAFGTGAIEIKSGYGLDLDAELKMLRVIKRLKENCNITIKATFLGAHAIPAAFKENREEYIRIVVEEMIPAIREENLADFIDVFCERNYFTVEEMVHIVSAGKKAGMVPKLHLNQFSILGSVPAAVSLEALSVDHLEIHDLNDIAALKNSSTIPVFLPACSHFISIPYGNARAFMNENIPVALASDYNPGSTPCKNLQFVWSLACVKMNMTSEEALNALTVNASYAMGISDSHGSITVGKKSPVLITKKIPSLDYIPYAFAENHIERVVF
jgi:imidazolonepropionase